MTSKKAQKRVYRRKTATIKIGGSVQEKKEGQLACGFEAEKRT
jgi:hypothetical protein